MSSSLFNRKRLLFIGALVLFALMVALLLAPQQERPDHEPQETDKKMKTVSYQTVTPSTYQGFMVRTGELSTQRTLNLTTTVSGRVKHVPSNIKNGVAIKKASLIAHIDDLPYKLAIQEAKQRLIEARIHAKQVQMDAEQALNNWKNSGLTGQPSELALQKPQLALSQAKVEAAELHLQQAQKQLTHTYIRAPFAGVIRSLNVTQHQQLQQGERILELVDLQQLSLRISLSEQQWQRLQYSTDTPLRLLDDLGQTVGHAHMSHVDPMLDSTTRQRGLFLSVTRNQHTPPLGTLVRVQLPTKPINNVLRLSSKSILQSSHIWLITQENTLKKVSVNVLTQDGEDSIVAWPDTHKATDIRVASIPLSSFIEGEHITPKAPNATPAVPPQDTGDTRPR